MFVYFVFSVDLVFGVCCGFLIQTMLDGRGGNKAACSQSTEQQGVALLEKMKSHGFRLLLDLNIQLFYGTFLSKSPMIFINCFLVRKCILTNLALTVCKRWSASKRPLMAGCSKTQRSLPVYSVGRTLVKQRPQNSEMAYI